MARRKKCSDGGGAPAWMATFSDMMTLLMCFFILLVAFSEMDIQRYRQLVGSMKEAFGVQREVKNDEIPKGYHAVLMELGPGRSRGAPIDEVKEPTTNNPGDTPGLAPGDPYEDDEALVEDVSKLQEALADEIADGVVHVEGFDNRIVVRVEERGAFGVGKVELNEKFAKVLDRIAPLLERIGGTIAVAGHTDDRPVHSRRFRSNWDVSAARAASVVHRLVADGLSPQRLVAQGYADSRPLAPNDSEENRARNRRVELVIIRQTAPMEWLGPDEGTGASKPAEPKADGANAGDEAAGEPKAAGEPEAAGEPADTTAEQGTSDSTDTQAAGSGTGVDGAGTRPAAEEGEEAGKPQRPATGAGEGDHAGGSPGDRAGAAGGGLDEPPPVDEATPPPPGSPQETGGE